MRVTISRQSGSQYVCKNEDGRTMTLSGSEAIGPSDDGVRPMQAVLMAMAGCSSLDIQLILQKGRHRVDKLEAVVDGERADAVPAVFTKIHVHFVAAGDFPEHKLVRAVDLSMEKYCSVATMLRPTVEITHSCELEASE